MSEYGFSEEDIKILEDCEVLKLSNSDIQKRLTMVKQEIVYLSQVCLCTLIHY